MDMDDDFMGEIEFDPSGQQQQIIQRAIDLASNSEDEFSRINPLIAIMQWWDASATERPANVGTPEDKLAEACRQYLLFHEKMDSLADGSYS